jgi:hypothetical protein
MLLRNGLIVIVTILSLSCMPVELHAGAPKLHKVSPQVGQRGTSIDVELRGLFLNDLQGIRFYEPGISVESVTPITEELVNGKTIPVPDGSRLSVKLNVSDKTSLGAIGFRVQTKGGLSEYQRFFVSPFPIVAEIDDSKARNDEPQNAQLITESSTVTGTLREAYDIDFYKYAAKQGERVSAEIVAARLGVERGLPDLHLAIYDANAELLAEADDSAMHMQDPVLSIKAPVNGEYFIAVRHGLYAANNDVYAVHVGGFARPTAVYPAGGKAGQELSVQVLGDPLGSESQTLQLPQVLMIGATKRSIEASDLSQTISVELKDTKHGAIAPTPNTLRLSAFDNVLELGSNDTVDEAKNQTASHLPIAFNGIIEKSGDVDCFKFAAKKGEQVRIHAIGSGLGTPVDLTIWVKQADGKGGTSRSSDSRINQHGLPPSNGVERVTVDPVLYFNVPSDGDYILGVEDERSGGSDQHVYRVECQLNTDAAFVYIPQEPENRQAPQTRQVINVPAGGRYNTTLSVVNTNRAYPGELELVASGLPEGVKMEAPRLTAEMTRVPVVFSADGNAGGRFAFAEIFARPVKSDENPSPEPLVSGYRQQVAMNSLGNNEFYMQIPLDKLAIAVTEPAPFDLEVEEPRGSLVQNGEMSVKFKINRHEGFTGPVTVAMEWKPNGINTVTPLSLKPEESEGEYLISAARNGTAGSYRVSLTAVNGNYQMQYRDPSERVYVSSKPFTLTIAEPHLDAKFARASVERGKTSKLVVTLNHLKPFSGKARASLARLPRGVEVLEEYQEFTAEDKEVTFTLKASNESLVGNYRGMTLDVTVDDGGQPVRQFTGYGSLRIDSQRGGKPAS